MSRQIYIMNESLLSSFEDPSWRALHGVSHYLDTSTLIEQFFGDSTFSTLP